jgi:striatin 1/3/4
MAWQSSPSMGGGGNGGNGGEVQQQTNQPQGTEYTLQGRSRRTPSAAHPG